MLSPFLTLIFWSFFMISGAVLQAALIIGLYGTRDLPTRHRRAQKYRLIWSALTLKLFFRTGDLRSLTQATASLPQQFILISNHRSNLDPLLVSVIGRPLVFLSKRAVLKTPVVGWWMRLCGDVSVDRADKSSREQSLNSMRERLQRGDSLLIFPEGTRQTDPSIPLGEFKDGAFNLAAQTGVPLVALVLHKTDEIWKKGRLTLNFPRLRFSVSEAIASQGRSSAELKQDAIQMMRTMIDNPHYV